jgi:prolyl-tRNA synthetase
MLDDRQFQNVVGGPPGYCGPVGAKPMRVVADNSLRDTKNWIVGANERDKHLTNANPGRDFDLSEFGDFTLVEAGDPCANCGTPLEVHRGIEVGHIFKLGTKYSMKMNCTYIDEGGTRQPMVMGCYGLGIGRTVAAAIEQSYDNDGIIWPVPIAPFEVVITAAGREEQVLKTAEDVYQRLLAAGVDVIFDDRDERPGVKFKDADLIGFPVRIVVGSKSLANGQLEWSLRKDKERKLGKPDEVLSAVIDHVQTARVNAA